MSKSISDPTVIFALYLIIANRKNNWHLCYPLCSNLKRHCILTDDTIYDVGITQSHTEKSWDHLLQYMIPIKPYKNFLEETKNEADNFNIALILFQ